MREPLVMPLKTKQWLVVLKFGVLVFWGVPQEQQEEWIKKLSQFFRDRRSESLSDNTQIITSTQKTGVHKGEIHLKKTTPESIAIMSLVMGRSLAMEHYENDIEQALMQFTPVMKGFEDTGNTKLRSKRLLKMVGKSMNVQHSILSHITLLDKPALTWEDPEMDKFYEELSVEYELEDRYETLSEKLKLLFQNVEFIQNYLDTRRGLMLEWIIIALILFEVILFVYDLWG